MEKENIYSNFFLRVKYLKGNYLFSEILDNSSEFFRCDFGDTWALFPCLVRVKLHLCARVYSGAAKPITIYDRNLLIILGNINNFLS